MNILKPVLPFLVIPLLFIRIYNISAQTECKVLLPAIGKSYSGGCKKGLAHGKGEAMGDDTYKGSFKEGLPSGEGIYTWKNVDHYEGSFKKGLREGKGKMICKTSDKGDSIIAGYWKEDKYFGKTFSGFEIISKSSSITYIKVIYKAPGPNDIEINGIKNSIDLSNNPRFYPHDNVYRNVSFPITIKLRGNSVVSINDIDFEIFFEKPGNWVLSIESL